MNTGMKLCLATREAVAAFISVMGSTNDDYILEDEKGKVRVDAKSMLGVMYATSESGPLFFLTNTSGHDAYPTGVDQFRQY